jgi:ATP/maltotriose-dependent transcriptional regulator MalT
MATQTGEQGSIVSVLGNLGSVAYFRGDLRGARKYLDDSLAKSRALGLKSDTALGLAWSGDVLFTQADFVAAEKDYSESLALRTQLGDATGTAGCQISFALLSLEKGEIEKARVQAADVVQKLHAENDSEQEASARDVLAQSLMAQGKLSEAKSEIAGATDIKAQAQTTRLSLAITSARLLAKEGKITESRRALQGVLQRASDMKLVGYQLLGRLAQAEVQAEGGDVAGARSNLRQLGRDANGLGFELIARKASAAESSTSPEKKPD